jgi:hypothetical protein
MSRRSRNGLEVRRWLKPWAKQHVLSHSMAVIHDLKGGFFCKMRRSEPDLHDTSVRVVTVAHEFENRDDLAADELGTDCSNEPRSGPESTTAEGDNVGRALRLGFAIDLSWHRFVAS